MLKVSPIQKKPIWKKVLYYIFNFAIPCLFIKGWLIDKYCEEKRMDDTPGIIVWWFTLLCASSFFFFQIYINFKERIATWKAVIISLLGQFFLIVFSLLWFDYVITVLINFATWPHVFIPYVNGKNACGFSF
jgi:hypothetical protein